MASTAARRSGGSTVPVGLAKVGWRQNSRDPLRANASSSRSGRTPCSSVGTGTGLSPAARADAMAP